MAYATVTMPDGRTWTPKFAIGIDAGKCIGCGRCFKICGHHVLALMAVDEDGNVVEISDEDDEYEKKVMTVARAHNCIGCEACARACGKKAYSHAPMEV